jgi:hypothetical protein
MSRPAAESNGQTRVDEKDAGAVGGAQAQEFPKNRLSVVFIGLMGCSFLSALDQACIAILVQRTLMTIYFADHRCDCLAYNRSTPRRWEEL